MSEEVSAAIAREVAGRSAMHADHASTRRLSEGYEDTGFRGEVAFARIYNLPLDWGRKPKGDSGIDFVVPLRHTIDVKTAQKPYHLIAEVGTVKADIYVLMVPVEGGDGEPLGWEWGKVLAKAPTRDFGYGVINHYIPRENLRSMAEFEARLMRLI